MEHRAYPLLYKKVLSYFLRCGKPARSSQLGSPEPLDLEVTSKFLPQAPAHSPPGWTWPLGVQIRVKVTAILPLPPRGHLHVSRLPPPWTAL